MRSVRLALGLGLASAFAAALLGCRTTTTTTSPVLPATHRAGVGPAPDRDRDSLVGIAIDARRRARKDEHAGLSNCVDGYYESAVYAYAALLAPVRLTSHGHGHGYGKDALHAETFAVDLYNASLADCLRTALDCGRIEPDRRLLIHAPGGTVEVPVVHKGFVWKTGDFQEVVAPCTIPRGRRRPTGPDHTRAGLGATRVVVRANRGLDLADTYLPPRSFFPATVVLRPDLDAWLGSGPAAPSGDVLEFQDPLRVRAVDLGGRTVPLAADLDAPIDLAERAVQSRRYTFTGFLNPSQELANAKFTFAEPYQPGKVVVLCVHGLLDNPYNFREIVNDLREAPGFLDHFQFAFYRYPTGNSFLRSAAILRRELRDAEVELDPGRSDPGFQNMVLLGYSMGGLISKLQITSSGDAVWNLLSRRPLDQIVTTEESRALLRELTYFEPQPFVRRTIFLATPHDGSTYATNALGLFARSLVQRPPDTLALFEQLRRDNPDAITRFGSRLPTSIDLLAVDNPLLDVMLRLPINPATPYHIIAGTGYLPDRLGLGDGIVPLWSARIDGAESEHHVAAVHTNITHSRDTSREIARILRVHLDGSAAPAAR